MKLNKFDNIQYSLELNNSAACKFGLLHFSSFVQIIPYHRESNKTNQFILIFSFMQLIPYHRDSNETQTFPKIIL